MARGRGVSEGFRGECPCGVSEREREREKEHAALWVFGHAVGIYHKRSFSCPHICSRLCFSVFFLLFHYYWVICPY